MKRKGARTTVLVGASLFALVALAIAAQDKYTVKVENGLSFSEFRGYETWQVVSISHHEPLMSVIVANSVMIKAYQAGIPGNGKPFPDGSKMANSLDPKKDGDVSHSYGARYAA